MNTIIFDIDDTLYDQAQSFHKTVRQMFAEPLSNEEIDKLYKTSRKYSEVLFDQSERGEITQFDWQTGRVIAACKDFGLPIDLQKAIAFHEAYVVEQTHISLFPEVRELLDSLHEQDKQLAILTNGEEQHQTMKINQLGLRKWFPIENIFISETVGHAKPKREVFEFVEKKLNLDQTKTVYVGDNYEKDIMGAKQAGWQAIWMNHRNRELPKDAIYQPDIEVKKAKELLEVFMK
ncbi:HAD family hydrolase [Pullulanibacillus sp. KACC 23026]|uniref:HAD family hydrolase n=1 Tax=Pullulanibacillus sp. KACC 23026 TaxID=3028315 RepID=UPI0023B08926|nr:HAD family hydrolase [Pullulanibacillus sp. KACC 23026]WEG14610.1 HAD family hydrolase [Pullulanibacillus sp. KACC 23026]